MFGGRGGDTHVSQIEISNTKARVFELLMRQCYTGRTEIPEELAADLLDVANFYGSNVLKSRCEIELSRHISGENIFQACDLAKRFDASYLRLHCVMFTLERSEQMITHYGPDRFCELTSNTLQRLRDFLVESLDRIAQAG